MLSLRNSQRRTTRVTSHGWHHRSEGLFRLFGVYSKHQLFISFFTEKCLVQTITVRLYSHYTGKLWRWYKNYTGQGFCPLEIRRRRRHRERQKSNRFNDPNNSFARALRFFVYLFAVTACTTTSRKCLILHFTEEIRDWSDDEISSLFLNLNMVLRNSTLGGFTNIWQC